MVKNKIELEYKTWKSELSEIRMEITEDDILYVVSKATGIPVEKITDKEHKNLLGINKHLSSQVIGQEEAINKISMTTNGSLLNESIASKLKESGLESITISLDSLSKKTNSYLNTTNQDYKKYVDDTKSEAPYHWAKGQIPKEKENHPVIYVNWFDATSSHNQNDFKEAEKICLELLSRDDDADANHIVGS